MRKYYIFILLLFAISTKNYATIPPNTNGGFYHTPSEVPPAVPPLSTPAVPPLSTPVANLVAPSPITAPIIPPPMTLPPIPDILGTPPTTTPPTTTTPASPGIVASASSAAYAAPTPLYCTNGKQMGLIAAKINPISTTLPNAPKGIPMLESTAQNPAPQGQSTLNDAKTLCAAAGGPDMKKLKQELEKQKYDTSVLKKIK